MSEKSPSYSLAGQAALAAVLLHAAVARADRGRLLVFVQTPVKQRALQSMLQGALPGLSVTAVGRVADFDRGLSQGPDAVLTLPEVMRARNLTPTVQGYRGGAADEPYALVGVDSAPAPGSVQSVGAVDLLGRDGTTNFVRRLVGSSVKVVRVTKVEDLLPLLQMQRADAVLTPARMVAELAAHSSLRLAQQDLGMRVGLPAIAGVGAGGAQAVEQAAKLAGAPARILGADSWK